MAPPLIITSACGFFSAYGSVHCFRLLEAPSQSGRQGSNGPWRTHDPITGNNIPKAERTWALQLLQVGICVCGEIGNDGRRRGSSMLELAPYSPSSSSSSFNERVLGRPPRPFPHHRLDQDLDALPLFRAAGATTPGRRLERLLVQPGRNNPFQIRPETGCSVQGSGKSMLSGSIRR